MQPSNDKACYILDDQVGYLLRTANQRHRAIFSELMPNKMPPMQFAAMVRLYFDGSMSQNLLGRTAAMDSATITGVVNRLRKQGWVSHRQDPGDRRSYIVDLTDEGRVMVERLLPAAAEITAATLEPLTRAEQLALVELLRKLSHSSRADGPPVRRKEP
ncbi:MAG: MarR family transcriptional regulator [Acidimicrobiales bacterium]